MNKKVERNLHKVISNIQIDGITYMFGDRGNINENVGYKYALRGTA